MVGLKLDDHEESRRELRAILSDAKLDHLIESSKFDRLSIIRSEFRSDQTRLTLMLQQGEISPEEYFERFNAALRETMAQNQKVLGHSDFVSVFGTAGREPEGLVDSQVFFSETRREPPKSRAR